MVFLFKHKTAYEMRISDGSSDVGSSDLLCDIPQRNRHLDRQGRAMSEQIVTVDIGGTHARFAIAEIEGGRVVSLGEATQLHTRDHESVQNAWQDFERQQGGELERAVAIAIAGRAEDSRGGKGWVRESWLGGS